MLCAEPTPTSIPEETHQVAQAAFPKGTVNM